MMLFRLIGNVIEILAYLVQWLLYWPARIAGSTWTLPILFGLSLIAGAETHSPAPMFVSVGLWGCFRLIFKIARRPHPLRLYRAPPSPPAPPPRAKIAEGKSDDPTEALVVGRLDPKLRDLLRQPEQ